MALAFHERLLAMHGGVPGLLDEGRLDAALDSPKNQYFYQGRDIDIFRLAAAYAHALTRDHPFVDGNKRVALVVAGVFLELNGFRLEASEAEAYTATYGLANHDLDEAGFALWLRESSKAKKKTKKGLPTSSSRKTKTTRVKRKR